MQVSANLQNFGEQVQQLKARRSEEGVSTPLGKDVSAMAQARNAERKAEKESVESTDNQNLSSDQVEITATNSENADSLLSKVVVSNINESLQPEVGSQDTQFQNANVPLSEIVLTQFSGVLDSFRTDNSALSEEESLSKFSQLVNSGVENGFKELNETLIDVNTFDDETLTNFKNTQTQLSSLIFEVTQNLSTS